MPNKLFDPKHWRDRAEEARAHAAEFQDIEAQRMLLEIAETYDRLAETAERISAMARQRGPS